MTDVLATAPEAGWYDDPLSTERYRWWDGDTWTGKVATKYLEPADAVAPPVVTPTVEHIVDDSQIELTPVAVEEPVAEEAEVVEVEPVVEEPAIVVDEPTLVEEPAAAESVLVEEPAVEEAPAAVIDPSPVSAEFAAVEAELALLAELEAEDAAASAATETIADPVAEPVAEAVAEPVAMTAAQIAEFAAMPQFLPDSDPTSPFADRWDDEPLAEAYAAPAAEDDEDDTAPKLDWASFDRVVAAAHESAAVDPDVELLPSGYVAEPVLDLEPEAAEPVLVEPIVAEPLAAEPIVADDESTDVHDLDEIDGIDDWMVAEQPVAATPAPAASADFSDLLAPAPAGEPVLAAPAPQPADLHVAEEPVISAPGAAQPAADEPVFAEYTGEAPAVAAVAASTVTGAAMLLAVWPLLLAATAAGAAAILLAPGVPAGVWGATAIVPIAAAIVGVILDRQALERRELPRAGAGWVLLTPLAYLVVRAARLGKGASRRFAPVVVGLVSTLLVAGAVAGGVVLSLPSAATLDQASALLEADLSTGSAAVSVDCSGVLLTIPGVPFDCVAYPTTGGSEPVAAVVDLAGTVTAG